MTRCILSYQPLHLLPFSWFLSFAMSKYWALEESHIYRTQVNQLLLACLGQFFFSLNWIQFTETITFVFICSTKLSIVQYCKNKNSTDFFFYPPITANLDFDILFDKPKLSEQTLSHQWRFIYIHYIHFIANTSHFSMSAT